MGNWLPLFVLPNLLVKEPVEVEYVALVPPDDPRCIQIGQTNHNFLPFLDAFTDAFQRQVIPSVLIVREDAPPWVMSMEAIGGFRDAISISAVVHNRNLIVLYRHSKTNQYSSFFDFYAWVFSKNVDMLTTNNPALWGLDAFGEFKGQSTAGLPTSRWDGLDVDEAILKALLGEWARRFSNPKPAWRSLALFRSLNMAHAAAQVPALVDVTSQSLERSVALWISAFEILTHPKDGDAGLKEVYRVFENLDWRLEACRDRVHECYEGRTRKLSARKRNLACWIYGELYHARNDYLHGNQLEDDRLVVKSSGRSLFMFTHSLYRLLLTGFLGIDCYGPFEKREAGASPYDDPQCILNFRFENRQGDYERAISRVLQSPAKRS
jgi:hypothetical protein